MKTAKKLPPDTADARPNNGLSKTRKQTRQGKARLLTLDALDFRTAAYADAKKLVERLSTDLGGDDQLSEGERQLVMRTAMTGAIVADFEARWVAGQPIALADYLTACRTQCRLLALLGLQRRPRDVSVIDGSTTVEWSPLRDKMAAKAIKETADG
jgi:hypothetical protein